MSRRWLPLAGILLAAVPASLAHRLDECLQAARLTVGTNRVDIELDVTPGMEVAARLVPLVDLDRDGRVSALESEAYADLVRSALELEVDGRRQTVKAVDHDLPALEQLRAGEGVIHLRFAATWPPLAPGAHHLRFRNSHQTNLSVYLCNALVPADARVAVTRQERDELQHELRLGFTVAPMTNPPPARPGGAGSR